MSSNSLDTPVVGLLARNDGAKVDVADVRARLAGAAIADNLREFGIEDELALLGNFIAGPRSLARFAADAPLNTDDRPIVTYLAPRITYVADSLPRDRLIGLLREVEISPDDLFVFDDDVAWRLRLTKYWSARNRFIEAGRDVKPSSDVIRMLAQVREPLLSVLHISSDFRPAYDPLLRMAGALATVDPAAARALLAELQHVQPARAEAAQALQDLSVRMR